MEIKLRGVTYTIKAVDENIGELENELIKWHLLPIEEALEKTYRYYEMLDMPITASAFADIHDEFVKAVHFSEEDAQFINPIRRDLDFEDLQEVLNFCDEEEIDKFFGDFDDDLEDILDNDLETIFDIAIADED